MKAIIPEREESIESVLKRCGAFYEQAEQHGAVLGRFADVLYEQLLSNPRRLLLPILADAAGLCGSPPYGTGLATLLAARLGKRRITCTQDAGRLILNVLPERGEGWWIVEGVLDDFSSTWRLISKIESYEAKVAGIICVVSGLTSADGMYRAEGKEPLPVVSLVQTPIHHMEDAERDLMPAA